MPLLVRHKMGLDYIYHPFFVQQLGVFGKGASSSDIVRDFLNAIPSKFKVIDTNLNTHNCLQSGQVKNHGITCHLDLIESYEQIGARYNENTRRNIKKATERGVFISSGGDPGFLIEAFRKSRGRDIGKFSEKDYKTLSKLIYTMVHKGVATIESAYSAENNFCAGAVFAKSFGKSIFLFSGTTPQARENGAMFLLIDNYIKRNAGQDMVLDFEGSKIPNLLRFYKGFGSKECVFLHVRINKLPLLLKPVLALSRFLRQQTG